VWWFSRPLAAEEIEELAGRVDCAQLQTQVTALQSQVATLTQQLQTVASGVDSIESSMRTAFNAPQFAIPGATPIARSSNLLGAILNLNKGQLQAIYRNLGGR